MEPELVHSCEEDVLTWHWTNIPTDTSEPGSDGYYVRVVVDEGPNVGDVLLEVPGAEDNAFGVDYSVVVPLDTGIYMQVINNADSFWFEYDTVISCPSTEVSSIQVLPYTGIADWLLPFAIILVAAGTGLLRLVRR